MLNRLVFHLTDQDGIVFNIYGEYSGHPIQNVCSVVEKCNKNHFSIAVKLILVVKEKTVQS